VKAAIALGIVCAEFTGFLRVSFAVAARHCEPCFRFAIGSQSVCRLIGEQSLVSYEARLVLQALAGLFQSPEKSKINPHYIQV
jgi:hypothetical protein